MANYQRHCSTIALLCFTFSTAAISGCGGGGGNTGSSSSALLTGKAIHELEGGACCHPPIDTPLSMAVLSFHTTASTAQIASTTTDAAGNYSVRLPRGVYEAALVNQTNEPGYNLVQPQ